jgi:hypothetical protein
MNIESKLRLLRKAKKRRVALAFHTRKIGGIDLDDEKLKTVLPFIKTLFKTLKAAKFEIEINHWGEIYLIEPERKIQLLLSVQETLNTKNISNIKKHLEGNDYFQQENYSKSNGIEVSFKANRQGTKWRTCKLPARASDHSIICIELIEQIKAAVSGLVSNVRFEIMRSIHEITSEDILCIINYGAILQGNNSQFSYILNDKTLGLIPKLLLYEDYLIVVNTFGRNTEMLLSKQSKKLISRFVG